MALTKSDRDEIRGMLTDQSAHIKELHDATIRPIAHKIDEILEQTKRTNGRVTIAEKHITTLQDTLPHSKEACPHKDTIQALRDNMLTAKHIRKLIISSITLTGVIVTIILSILQYLER
jgi:hypothetical protein